MRDARRNRAAVKTVAAICAAALCAAASGCSSQPLNFSLNPFSHKASAAVSNAPPPPPPANAAPWSSTVAAAAAPAGPGDVIDGVVATVDGTPITSRDLKTFKASGAAAGGMGQLGAGAASNDPQATLKALITQRLLEEESQKFADKVSEDDINRYIQNIEERNHVTDDQLRSQLAAQNISYDEFRKNIRKQVQAMAMISREVRSRVQISDSEVEDYYKEHHDEFTVSEETFTLAQILIAVPPGSTAEQVAAAQTKAEDVRKQAVKGADFGDLARQYSDDDSKSKGGELGSFSRSELNDDIAAGIANLNAGDVSTVIRSKYGFHIVKVEAHEKAGTRSFDEVKGMIRDKLANDRAKSEFQKWIDEDLVKRHFVETMN